MKALANTVIAAVDLAEAEGCALRRAFQRIVLGTVLIVIAGALAVGGAFCVTWAAFEALGSVVVPPLAAAIIGAALFLVAGAMLWTGKRLAM